jgi:hypothetical protein
MRRPLALWAWARVFPPLSFRHVWPGSSLFRRERDQAGLLDPSASTDPELRAELECRAHRSAPGGPKARERSLDVLRWGLVPFWAKDLKVGFANINAKAEGIENRPAFRDAFERRRCLVPVAVALPLMLAEIEADIATAGPIERCRLSRPSWVWRRIGGPAPAQR